MLSISSTQPSQSFTPTLSYYGKQLQRPWEMALPFLKLNPVVRQVCSASKEAAALVGHLSNAVRERHLVKAFAYTIQAVIGIVAAILEYRAAKIVKDSLGLLKDLKKLVQAIPNQDLDRVTTLFWTVVLSAVSLGLTLIKSTELILAFELVNLAVSLHKAMEEAKDEKHPPEMFAHLAMACVRVYRSSEPLTGLLERRAIIGSFGQQFVFVI